MEKRIRVIQYGLGLYGKQMVRIMLTRERIECVGAVVKKTGVGKDLGEVVGLDKRVGVRIFGNTKVKSAIESGAKLNGL
jgi:hypothetical protein